MLRPDIVDLIPINQNQKQDNSTQQASTMAPNSESAMQQISYISSGYGRSSTLSTGSSSRDEMSSAASENDLVFVTSYTDFDK